MTKKWIVIACLLTMTPLLVLGGIFISFFMIAGGQNQQPCATTGLQVSYNGPGLASLTPLQMSRAAAVIAAGRQMQIPDRGIVVALATASQESGFKVYANDGQGGDLAGDQQGIAASLNLPHDAVGTDHGSLGIFQQQWPWWGSMDELMDPATSARKFYEALQKVPGWQSLDVTVAAQRVQHSAYPSAYADDQPLAEQLLAKIGSNYQATGGAEGSVVLPASAQMTGTTEKIINGVYIGGVAPLDAACAMGTGVDLPAGSWAHPIAGAPVTSPYGPRSAPVAGASSFHEGTDYGAPCGTAFHAIASGRVIAAGPATGYGHWIRIDHGQGIVSEYGHMFADGILVRVGDQVSAGKTIGRVGSDGFSSGCHLHLTIDVNGKSVDPEKFLSSAPTGPMPGSPQTIQAAATAATPGAIRVASFNTLGHSHTDGPGADQPGFPSSKTRTRGMVQLLEQHQLDVVGLQEFQPAQVAAFDALAGSGWGRVSNKDNAVIWRTGKFDLVGRRTVAIPYFGGTTRQMPLVELRQRSTGTVFTVISVHNPADKFGSAGQWRRQAEQIERATVRSELAAGRPVLLMGDFNDRDLAFCAVTADGLLSASAGGSNAGACNPPQHQPVDWVFGAKVGFSGHTIDRTSTQKKISDHPMVTALAELGGAGSAASPGQLRVMTYNVHHGTAGTAKIAQEISSSGADVVALQDADNHGAGAPQATVQALASRLGMQYAYTHVGTWQGRELIDNAILSRFPIVDADKTLLPGDDGLPPRGLLQVTVSLGAQQVDIYATHLQATGDIRLEQASAVRSEISRVSCPTVLLGNLNFAPDQPMYPVITTHLADVFSSGHFGAGKTAPAARPTARLDYILRDKSSKVTDARVLPAGGSDHRAVLASLTLDRKETC